MVSIPFTFGAEPSLNKYKGSFARANGIKKVHLSKCPFAQVSTCLVVVRAFAHCGVFKGLSARGEVNSVHGVFCGDPMDAVMFAAIRDEEPHSDSFTVDSGPCMY